MLSALRETARRFSFSANDAASALKYIYRCCARGRGFKFLPQGMFIKNTRSQVLFLDLIRGAATVCPLIAIIVIGTASQFAAISTLPKLKQSASCFN